MCLCSSATSDGLISSFGPCRRHGRRRSIALLRSSTAESSRCPGTAPLRAAAGRFRTRAADNGSGRPAASSGSAPTRNRSRRRRTHGRSMRRRHSAVSMTMGTRCPSGNARSARQQSKPSPPGISTSSSTTAGRCRRNAAMPSSGPAASSTRKPSGSSVFHHQHARHRIVVDDPHGCAEPAKNAAGDFTAASTRRGPHSPATRCRSCRSATSRHRSRWRRRRRTFATIRRRPART